MKLKTNAVTPGCARCAGRRRSRSAPSAAVNSFSYRTGTGEPAGIMFSDEAREVFARALLQGTHRLLQSRLAGRRKPHLPARQLRDQLDPLAPRERRPAPALELAEAGDEVAREALLANASTLEEPRDDREHLARMHRLHEVIVDLGADRVAQQRVVLALRDHD